MKKLFFYNLLLIQIHHFHIFHNAPHLPPVVFIFSWDGCNTQEKWQTKVVQNFGEQIRCIVGNVEVAYAQ